MQDKGFFIIKIYILHRAQAMLMRCVLHPALEGPHKGTSVPLPLGYIVAASTLESWVVIAAHY